MSQDLEGFIDYQGLECLNERPQQPATNAIKQGYREDPGLLLESDTDEQLLINIPFNQAVKLQSLILKGPTEGANGPLLVKLFVNRPHFGFSDVGSVPCAQEFVMTNAQLAGESVSLKFVKFQSVTQLTIFVETNQGGEPTTQVSKLQIFGISGEKFDVKDIKKQDEHSH